MIHRVLVAGLVLTAAVIGAPAAEAAVKCVPTTVQPRTAMPVVQPSKNLKPVTYTFTVKTNCGVIKIAADAKLAPITVRNLAGLAKKRFFNKSLCHRLTTDQIFILQCGDPTASGTGGPGFKFVDENLPTDTAKNKLRYPAGTVAMANSGVNTNGSQFFFVYRDGTYDLPANYTIWGHVTAGLDILKAIAARGTTTGGADGWPAQAIAVLSVTVSEGTP